MIFLTKIIKQEFLFDNPNGNPEDNIVKLIEKYSLHRPKDSTTPNSFFLAINDSPRSNVWYKRQKMGKNFLGSILSFIA